MRAYTLDMLSSLPQAQSGKNGKVVESEIIKVRVELFNSGLKVKNISVGQL